MYFLGFVNRFFGVFRLLIHGLKLVGLNLGKLNSPFPIGQEIDDLLECRISISGNDQRICKRSEGICL